MSSSNQVLVVAVAVASAALDKQNSAWNGQEEASCNAGQTSAKLLRLELGLVALVGLVVGGVIGPFMKQDERK
jgi:hypothetical protein